MRVAIMITTALRRMSADRAGWRWSSSSTIVDHQRSRLAVSVLKPQVAAPRTHRWLFRGTLKCWEDEDGVERVEVS
jgi:hypothetical protein